MEGSFGMLEVYQLHILLRVISPAIWRRALVRSDSTIKDLHYTIQITMGWSDSHLNRFSIHGKEYGVYHVGGLSFPDDPDDVTLVGFDFRPKERFLYEYNFIDGWTIDIRLDGKRRLNSKHIYPVCISGSRAGPPECPACGSPRSLKGHHSLVCRTVFGKVALDSPRYGHYWCKEADHRSFSPLANRLSERTTSELAYLECKWASLMSYGLTVDILSEVLPLDGQVSTASVRRQVQRVAERMEQSLGPEQGIYIEGCSQDWGQLPRPDDRIMVGIDGGFVRGLEGKSRGEGHFEVIAGKSMAENDSKCFAYVTRNCSPLMITLPGWGQSMLYNNKHPK